MDQLKEYDGAAEQPVTGVGMALPPSVGERVRAGRLADAQGGFQALLGGQLGHPVLIEAVATAGALGERWLGSGRHLDSFYYLSISDDVSGTLMARGRPDPGTRGRAGALASVPLLILFSFLMRSYIEGLTSGSLKG